MKLAEIIAWTRTQSDSRDTASDVTTLIGPQSAALAAAIEIECNGATVEGRNLPSGHGVTIRYASGKTRILSRRDIESVYSQLSPNQGDEAAVAKFKVGYAN